MAYLTRLGLWQSVKDDMSIQPLGDIPTFNQMRVHAEEEAKEKLFFELVGENCIS